MNCGIFGRGWFGVFAAAALVLGADRAAAQDDAQIARGRYLVEIANCNGCHTAAPRGAKLPEKDWLEGNRLGFHGPWGTTYPVNLRLLVSKLSEADWLAFLHAAKPRPPMPWAALQAMTAGDQKALYAFIRHLGPAGKEAPGDLPPGVAPPPPFAAFPTPPPATAKTPG